MTEFADLRELFRLHQAGGGKALALEARENLDAAIDGLMRGLVASFTRREVGGAAFVFQWHVVVFPQGDGAIPFFLSCGFEGGLTAERGTHPNPTVTLRAPLDKMIYIICGMTRDSDFFRAKLFSWFHSGEISGDGELMLLQRMQGSFGGGS